MRARALESMSWIELSTCHAASPAAAYLARGDGHPVLVLPGFASTDTATAPLRRLLRWRGHEAHGWNLGVNTGAHEAVVDRLFERLEELAHDAGQPVSVVGWSLGGVFAREMARQRPELVRQVITLSAPFRFRDGDRGSVSTLYDTIGPRDEHFAGRADAEHRRPLLEVPVTSIYTRSDGIVTWHACLEVEGPRCENVEVLATHTGIGCNLLAALVVADRLAQPTEQWKPFRPPALLRGWYPRPASWRGPAAAA